MASSKRSIVDIIVKKRDGHELSKDDIDQFIESLVQDGILDSQLGAMLMAIYFKDMSDKETIYLTRAMTYSGTIMNWPDSWKGKVVDKHSTGGVGDKISLVLAPALASCGMKVPMISGRGIGHTGGTLDKLESIPGFNVFATPEEMRRILEQTGCCIVSQTSELVPADKIMYKTRDVTGTVGQVGLIAASIMSKKAAESPDALVLDVKCGRAATLTTKEESRKIASRMVAIGKCLGIKMVALLTAMDVPIGRMIGNSLEVVESLQCLHGSGPDDVMDLVYKLGSHLLYKSQNVLSIEEGEKLLKDKIENGEALSTICNMLKGQGVNPDVAIQLCCKDNDVWEILPRAQHTSVVACKTEGYVHDIDALQCAAVVADLTIQCQGSGLTVHGVGLEILVRVGEKVMKGTPWVKVYHNEDELSESLINTLQNAIVVKETFIELCQTRVMDVFE